MLLYDGHQSPPPPNRSLYPETGFSQCLECYPFLRSQSLTSENIQCLAPTSGLYHLACFMVHSCCSVSFPSFLRQRIHCIYKLRIIGLFPSFGCHSVAVSLEVELTFGSWGCIFLNRGMAVPGHMAILCPVFGGATLLFSTTSLFYASHPS